MPQTFHPVRRHAHCGFTLMELMVGIAVGLLVVVAAIGSLIYTRIAATVVSDTTQLQQRADAILRNLGSQIAQAGAIELNFNPAEPDKLGFSTAFEGFNPAVTGAAPGVVLFLHGVDGGPNGPDTLRVSFEDNGSARDCLGNRPSGTPDQQTASGPTFARIDSQYAVQGGQLVCKGAGNTGAQSLGDSVEDFQLLYAVRLPNTVQARLQYFNASQISASPAITPNWTQVLAVRVCLQMVGDGLNHPGPTIVGCRGQIVPADGRLRRVFERSFTATNALALT